MADQIEHLDLRGLLCPLPVLRLQARARVLPAFSILEVVCDDPIARVDIPHAMRESGHECEELSPPDAEGSYCVFKVTLEGKD